MAFSISPGVTVSEVDLTTVVPSVLTTAGAIAGYFNWGPANKIILIDNQVKLATRYAGSDQSGPDSNSAINFFTAANFLAYGNNLQVVRVVGANSNNATSGSRSLPIPNIDAYQYSYLSANNTNTYGAFAARYPGVIGNTLQVAVCSNTAQFSSWAYSGYFTSAPNTSSYVTSTGGAYDEMHIVVIDANGLFSGTKGTVLETFPFVSKATDAVNLNDGSSNYYRQVIFNKSRYIQALGPVDYTNTAITWDTASTNKTYANLVTNITSTLTNGSDEVPTDGQLITNGWSMFNSKETTDVSLILTSNSSTTVQQYIIDNIATARADCIAFISPPSTAVVNNMGNESSSISTWLTSLSRSNSYTVADSGWKYQFDAYNNVYRWIPLNGDIAGLCVYTDTIADPWVSPAGFNRGAIKNCIRLAWNPSKTYRDTIYAAGVNPVVSFPGQGTVLFGDKTLQAKPSAFDRINVRRLFLVLEKAISKAAQYSLFEFNDNYTQSQFISLVTPYLRTIQGRRGITDFKVVCDSTNNTPSVVDANQFVGDIYIKPARSVNFIQLNFVAVGTGVDFNTIVGVST